MYRFLLSRKWIGFAIFVIALSALCTRLGFWQIHRLEHRLDTNALITKHFNAAPVDLQAVLKIGTTQRGDQQWTRVTASGSYDVEHQATVRFATRDGAPGAEVITPFVLASGNAILVDRGWIATPNNSAAPVDIAAPPSGTVTIEGWLRANSRAKASVVTPANRQVRAISSVGLADFVPHPLYDGYLNLRHESPAAAQQLELEPKPELGQGPHLFYALQWWFFAALGTFGWFYFAWAEERERRKQRALEAHRAVIP